MSLCRRLAVAVRGVRKLGSDALCPPATRRLQAAGTGSAATTVAWVAGLCLSLAVHGWAAEPAVKPVPVAQASPAGEFEQLAQIKVTSVSRQESTVQQSPAAIFVITPEMIRRSGATAIPELFRMVPGMDVARIDGNKWAVSSRGFNDRFVGKQLVQIDGRTLYNPILSGVYWDTVDYPLEDIERIEVIRGPGASVWGANAVNGIINIITKSAKDTPGGVISAGGGSTDRGFGEFRYGGQFKDDLSYRVYGKGFTREKDFFALGDPHDSWEGGSGGFRLDYQPESADRIMFDGGFYHSAAERQDLRPQPTAPFFFSNVDTDVSDGAHLLGRWSRQLADDSTWTLQAYWDRVHRSSAHIVDWRWDTYDVDFQHHLALGERQKLTYGTGYRLTDATLVNSKRDNGFDLSWASAHRSEQTFSAFVQDEISLVENRLALTLGSKFEHNDVTGFEVQPTARLLWNPSPRQSVWAGVSRAVRTPNFLEDSGRLKTLTTPGGTTFFEIRGNGNLASEELLAYDLGYRIQATEKLTLDLASFYNVYSKLIGTRAGAPEPSPPISITPLNRENTLSAETYGMELACSWQISDTWRLHGTYSLLKMNLHRAPGLPASAEAAEGQSPQQQVYLQSSWDLPNHVELDLMGRFVDRLRGFNLGAPAAGVPNVIAQYVSLDARLSWRPRKHWELSVVGQNLLDAYHPESGTSPIVRSPLVELRRSIYGKITWRF